MKNVTNSTVTPTGNKLKAHTEKSRTGRFLRHSALVTVMTLLLAVPAFATGTGSSSGDALTAITNFSNYFLAILRAVGVAVCIWGAAQFGISLQHHDASQRTQGIFIFVGGLIIVFVKELLTTIGVSV